MRTSLARGTKAFPALLCAVVVGCGGGPEGSLGESGRVLTRMFETMHNQQVAPLATLAQRACLTQDDDESLDGVSAYGEAIVRLPRAQVGPTLLKAATVWSDLGWEVDSFLAQRDLRSRSVYARRGQLNAGFEVEGIARDVVTLRLFGVSDCFPPG